MKIKRILAGLSLVGSVGLAAAMPGAALAAQVFHQDIPINATVSNPCDTDDVDTINITGDINVLENVPPDGQGGFNATIHENGQGLGGVDNDGNKYNLPLTENVSLHLAPGAVETVTLNEKLIPTGNSEEPTFSAHVVEHVTVDPNGNVTVLFVRADVDCS
jgi:hypothetical protein